MDGEYNGKAYEQMDDLGVPLFLETPIWCLYIYSGLSFYNQTGNIHNKHMKIRHPAHVSLSLDFPAS